MASKRTLKKLLVVMRVEELKDALSEAGAPIGGAKDALADRLAGAILDQAISFEEAIGYAYADQLSLMCETVNLGGGGRRDALIEKLVDWFEAEFGGSDETDWGPALAPGDAPVLTPTYDAGADPAYADFSIGTGPSAPTARDVRPYQAEAMGSLSAAYERFRRVLLVLPTGGGKTFVAAKWIADVVVPSGGRVLWLAHREELLRQAGQTFADVLPHDGSRRVSWWTSKAKEEPGQIVLASVSVRTVPSMPVDLLVIDEAHHAAASSYKEWRSLLRPRRELGLTATPERRDDAPLGYEHVAYRKSFWDLVSLGYLARPDLLRVNTNVRATLRYDELKRDFDESSLDQQLNTPQRNRLIASTIVQNAAMLGKTLVFAINVRHCDELVQAIRQLSGGRLRVDTITGGTASSTRDATVEAFKAGRLDVLVNCKVFIEGFDCPDVRSVVVTRPTTSAVFYLQMIGRGARLAQGKRAFHLVDFADQLDQYADKLAGMWNILEASGELPATAPRKVPTFSGTTEERELPTGAAPPSPSEVLQTLPLDPTQLLRVELLQYSVRGVVTMWTPQNDFLVGLVFKPAVEALTALHEAVRNRQTHAVPTILREVRSRLPSWSPEFFAGFERVVGDPQRWNLYLFAEKPLPEAYPPPPSVRDAVTQLGDQLRMCNAAVDFVTTVPGTQVDWGVDQDTWLRTLSVERAKFAGVARVLDPITHTVVRPLKVLVADEAKLVGALEEVRAAARARSRAAFLDPVPLIRSAYDAHLVGALVDYGDFDALARTLLRDPDAEVYRRLAT